LMPEQKQPLLDNLADDNAAAQDNRGEAGGNGQR